MKVAQLLEDTDEPLLVSMLKKLLDKGTPVFARIALMDIENPSATKPLTTSTVKIVELHRKLYSVDGSVYLTFEPKIDNVSLIYIYGDDDDLLSLKKSDGQWLLSHKDGSPIVV